MPHARGVVHADLVSFYGEKIRRCRSLKSRRIGNKGDSPSHISSSPPFFQCGTTFAPSTYMLRVARGIFTFSPS
jgi:hypothetical protein